MLLVAFGARGGAVIRLGLIFGGRSAEHEVSVVSAEHVIAAVEHEEFEVVPIGVTKDGVWLSTQETRVALSRAEVAFKKRVVGTAGGVGTARCDDRGRGDASRSGHPLPQCAAPDL